jgi:hypothetical protein
MLHVSVATLAKSLAVAVAAAVPAVAYVCDCCPFCT